LKHGRHHVHVQHVPNLLWLAYRCRLQGLRSTIQGCFRERHNSTILMFLCMLVLYMYYTCITIATARVFDASVIATSGVSVSLSVRPSITRWYTESRQMNMRFLHSVSVNSSSQAYTLNKTKVRENGVKRRFPKFVAVSRKRWEVPLSYY